MRARHYGLVILLAAACGEDGGGSDYDENLNPGANGNADPGGAIDVNQGGANGLGGTGGLANGGTGVGAAGIPCEVQAVVDTHCGTCHGNSPQFGAPMPLVSLADFAAASPLGGTYADRALARIYEAEPARLMPPVSQDPMPEADRTLFANWVNGGMQGPACGGVGAGSGGGVGGGAPGVANGDGAGGDSGGLGAGIGGDIGGGINGGSAGGNAGGLPDRTPVGDEECDYIFEVRAHGQQAPGDTSPYQPSRSGGADQYIMFYHTPPWNEEVQIIKVDSIIDNSAILHHWLLYQEPNSSARDGSFRPNIGLHSAQTQLITGWAPGGEGLHPPSDVGVQTVNGPGARFAIEIHYNVSAGAGSLADRSGARVCATRKLRPKVAAVHWLGTEAIIFASSVTGYCRPKAEAHILGYSPHMHKNGRHMKTIITRADGTQETLLDKPFAFTEQVHYDVDSPTGEVVVRPGDVLATTCDYSGPSTFGPGTNAEMCYNFVLAWPAGALSNASGAAGVVGGENTCIAWSL